MKIISKPKSGTLFSLGAFLLGLVLILIWLISDANRSQQLEWYHLASFVFLPAIILVLIVRTAAGYKVITLYSNKITVKYWYSGKPLLYALPEKLQSWDEVKVRTNGQDFIHFTFHFNNGESLSLSNKEYSEYERLSKSIKKKYAKYKSQP